MAWDPPWDPAIHDSHAPGVGAGEPRASAATRRVEGAPAAATADGYGPDLLGGAVEALEGLAEFAAGGAARDRGRLAPAGVQALLGVGVSMRSLSFVVDARDVRANVAYYPIGNGNKGTSPVAKHIFWPDGRFTYKDTFPHAKLTRSPEGVLEMVLHTNGDTLIFNGYTHEEFVKLFHQINQDAETRVVIPTGANEAFIDRIDAEGFDFFSPRGYDKIYREGKKALLNLIASLSRRRTRCSRISRTSLSASCRATASIRYGRRSLGRSAIARSCSLSS